MVIDWWTLGLQTVNVAILVWLLQRFFWRPVAAMIGQRRMAAQTTLAEAAAAKAAAAASLAEIAGVRAGFAAERAAILAKAAKEAEEVRAARLLVATQDADKLRDQAAAEIAAGRAAETRAMAAQASRLAVEIAGRLMARLDGAAARWCFLDWMADALAALPAEARASASAAGAALEVVSATALDAAAQATIAARIAAVLGGTPSLSFRTDPALIAGLELHGPHFVLRNSWQADLDVIQQELAHEP